MGDIEIETRYPVHWSTRFTEQEAAIAKSAANRVRQVITKTLSSFLQFEQEQIQ
jgi:hypothetical protein